MDIISLLRRDNLRAGYGNKKGPSFPTGARSAAREIISAELEAWVAFGVDGKLVNYTRGPFF